MRRPPDWPATLAEFVAHAARDETLRRAYVRIRERFLAAIADVIEALCEKHGLTLLVPPLEAPGRRHYSRAVTARSAGSNQDAVSPEMFVELHAGFMRGLTVPKERSRA